MADLWGSSGSGGAGAASSLAASNPWSAGFMAAGSVATAALNDKTNMNAQQSTGAQTFDNSGWSVNLGLAGPASQSTTATQDKSAVAAGLPQLMNNPLVLAVLVLIAFELVKRK